ncbi:acyl-CoA carboxylase subunit epsilon [Streptomyces sp. NPDC004549]
MNIKVVRGNPTPEELAAEPGAWCGGVFR